MMITYMQIPTGVIVSIEEDEAGWFIATAYDLPGCVAQGRSILETVDNMTGSIEDAILVMEQDEVLLDVSAPSEMEDEPSWSVESVRIDEVQAS